MVDNIVVMSAKMVKLVNALAQAVKVEDWLGK